MDAPTVGPLRSPPERAQRVVEGQVDGWVQRVEDLATQQRAALDAATTEARYKAALAGLVSDKQFQAADIEERLESLIQSQEGTLAAIEVAQPGFLAGPRQRQRWQSQVTQQQALVQRLHTRLDHVRELKDGMGLTATRIEEMAAQKLRAQQPDLVMEWDELQATARWHHALQRSDAAKCRQNQQTPSALLTLSVRPEL